MNRFQKIFMGLLILAVIFLTVYSNIQMGYAKKEKEKAIEAQFLADENARAAEEQAAQAARAMADAANQMELLKSELEACKSEK